MTDDERLEAWLAGDLPVVELPAFQAWLRADPAHRRRHLTAVALDQDLRCALRLPARLLPPLRRSAWRGRAAWAAAALILLAAGALVWARWWRPGPVGPLPPPPPRQLAGWRLDAALVVRSGSRAPRPEAVSGHLVEAPYGGRLSGPLGTVGLAAGTRVRLRPVLQPTAETAARIPAQLVLLSGSLRMTSAAPERPAPFAYPGIAGQPLHTPVGSLVVAPGTRCRVRVPPATEPDGRPALELRVEAGRVAGTGRAYRGSSWTAGARVRLYRGPDGTWVVEDLEQEQ